MKYEIENLEIMYVLKMYDTNYDILGNTIRYNEDFVELTEELIEKIKQGKLDKNNSFLENEVVHILNPYFDDCFTESKYEYDDCVEKLENLGFKVKDGYVYFHDCTENGVEENRLCSKLNVIVDRLKGSDDYLDIVDCFIYTLLREE